MQVRPLYPDQSSSGWILLVHRAEAAGTKPGASGVGCTRKRQV